MLNTEPCTLSNEPHSLNMSPFRKPHSLWSHTCCIEPTTTSTLRVNSILESSTALKAYTPYPYILKPQTLNNPVQPIICPRRTPHGLRAQGPLQMTRDANPGNGLPQGGLEQGFRVSGLGCLGLRVSVSGYRA